MPEDPRQGGTSTGGINQTSRLPMPMMPFLGREDDIARVLGLLDDPAVRLLTVSGPGGVGKTRLAIEVARRVASDFADSVRFIPLAAIRDPGVVLPAVAEALGSRERGSRDLLDVLEIELRDRHLLLVLDNFEHLLRVTPMWLADLLGRCPRITGLVTSRTILNIGGNIAIWCHRFRSLRRALARTAL